MSNTSPADDTPQLLDRLRSDLETMPGAAEARLRERLAGAMFAAAAAKAAPDAAHVARLAKASWLHSRGFAVALALPLGAVLGAWGHASIVDRERPKVSAPLVGVAPSNARDPEPSLARPIPVAALSVAPVVSAALAAAPPAVDVKAVPHPSSTDAVAATDSDRELRLLEQARTRLADGDAPATLQLLRAHERAYPTSPLQQERDALTIKALVAAGQSAEATKRAETFRARYPQGLLRDSVDRAVGKNP